MILQKLSINIYASLSWCPADPHISSWGGTGKIQGEFREGSLIFLNIFFWAANKNFAELVWGHPVFPVCAFVYIHTHFILFIGGLQRKITSNNNTVQPIIMRLCCRSDQSYHMTLSEEFQVSTSRHQWAKLHLLPARNSLAQIVVAATCPDALNSLNCRGELGELLGHKLLHGGGELLGGSQGSCGWDGLGSLGPVYYSKSFRG